MRAFEPSSTRTVFTTNESGERRLFLSSGDQICFFEEALLPTGR